MSRFAIAVSTCERRELTGLCLEAIERCKGDAEVYIFDDASTEYSHQWLVKWGHAYRISKRVGVGESARRRLAYVVERSTAEYILCLDNDALVRPGFVEWTWTALDYVAGKYPGQPAIVSPYRSSGHDVVESIPTGYGFYLRMKDIGGISMGVTRATALTMLSTIAQPWDEKWDYAVSGITPHLLAPHRSFIEHAGRFGGGVNGESGDRGFGYWGDE